MKYLINNFECFCESFQTEKDDILEDLELTKKTKKNYQESFDKLSEAYSRMVDEIYISEVETRLSPKNNLDKALKFIEDLRTGRHNFDPLDVNRDVSIAKHILEIFENEVS